MDGSKHSLRSRQILVLTMKDELRVQLLPKFFRYLTLNSQAFWNIALDLSILSIYFLLPYFLFLCSPFVLQGTWLHLYYISLLVVCWLHLSLTLRVAQVRMFPMLPIAQSALCSPTCYFAWWLVAKPNSMGEGGFRPGRGIRLGRGRLAVLDGAAVAGDKGGHGNVTRWASPGVWSLEITSSWKWQIWSHWYSWVIWSSHILCKRKLKKAKEKWGKSEETPSPSCPKSKVSAVSRL